MVFLAQLNRRYHSAASRNGTSSAAGWMLKAIAVASLASSSFSQASDTRTVTFTQGEVAQTFPITQGSTNYLDSEGQGFTIIVTPHNFGACDKLTGTVVTSFTDTGKGQGSFESHAFSFKGVAGTETYIDYGGNALITYSINSGPTSTISFNVRGNNPPASYVDEYATTATAPWFFPLILGQESTYQQFLNHLPNIGKPDGIGISQIDATANSVTDYDYWETANNIFDGIAVENGKQASAYSFFQSQLNQAGPSNPPPASPGFPSCSFSNSPNNSTTRPWKDADWIHAYNGTGNVYGTCASTGQQLQYTAGYYITWVLPTGSIKGYWLLRTTQGGPNDCFNGRSYVGDVCKQPKR